MISRYLIGILLGICALVLVGGETGFLVLGALVWSTLLAVCILVSLGVIRVWSRKGAD